MVYGRCVLPRSRHLPVASTEGTRIEKVNKTGVRLWIDRELNRVPGLAAIRRFSLLARSLSRAASANTWRPHGTDSTAQNERECIQRTIVSIARWPGEAAAIRSIPVIACADVASVMLGQGKRARAAINVPSRAAASGRASAGSRPPISPPAASRRPVRLPPPIADAVRRCDGV